MEIYGYRYIDVYTLTSLRKVKLQRPSNLEKANALDTVLLSWQPNDTKQYKNEKAIIVLCLKASTIPIVLWTGLCPTKKIFQGADCLTPTSTPSLSSFSLPTPPCPSQSSARRALQASPWGALFAILEIDSRPRGASLWCSPTLSPRNSWSKFPCAFLKLGMCIPSLSTPIHREQPLPEFHELWSSRPLRIIVKLTIRLFPSHHHFYLCKQRVKLYPYNYCLLSHTPLIFNMSSHF